MPNERVDLRRIDWVESFPFVRLFRTFSYAVRFERMALAFVLVVLVYLTGNILDRVWLAAGGGITVMHQPHLTAIDAYTEGSAAEYAAAVNAASEHFAELSKAMESAETSATTDWADQLATFYDKQIETLEDDADKLRQAAFAHDALVFRLASKDLPDELAVISNKNAMDELRIPDDVQMNLVTDLKRADLQRQLNRQSPIGPYAALQTFVMRAASGAVEGAASMRLGLSGEINSGRPSLAACVIQGFEGLLYIFFYRPWYALVFGLVTIGLGAYLGGAILRHAAVHVTRDETIGIGDAFEFTRLKLPQLLLAPLGIIGGILLVCLVLVLSGLIGAIPAIGPVISGLLFGLALLGGLLVTLALIATAFSIHLMWPLIAVEGSDAYDALSRGASYAGQQLWNLVFYYLVLLTYGSFALLFVRLMAMFVLKVTHATVSIGMSFFGSLSSAETLTVDRLSAMWQMPTWSDLSLLPSIDGVPFWGDFFFAPRSGFESLATVLIAFWVFLVVALVAAFALSFYFCGCIQVYLLIRRDHDAVDYDDVYYEGEEVFPIASGTSLPVVAGGPSPIAEKAPDTADKDPDNES